MGSTLQDAMDLMNKAAENDSLYVYSGSGLYEKLQPSETDRIGDLSSRRDELRNAAAAGDQAAAASLISLGQLVEQKAREDASAPPALPPQVQVNEESRQQLHRRLAVEHEAAKSQGRHMDPARFELLQRLDSELTRN